MITDALGWLADLPFPLVLLVAGLASTVESGLGIGMIFPGETGVLILATTATGVPRFVALVLVVAIGACLGDHVGYVLGRRYGLRLRETRLVRKLGVDRWDRAMAALHRYGASAVVVTRLIPVVRTLAPAAAGVSTLAYRRFLPASLAAGLLWAGTYVGVGAFAGASVRQLEAWLGRAGWLVLGALLLAGLAIWWYRRRRTVQSARSRSANCSPKSTTRLPS
ncbi:membrane protein DedA with SNARE-associated domain [Tamaricihabitans halophyticus]|uniref:Membrane protein DedA with SNARE-associated domain n=1 Tax=Tamaricihabitans halophyticus TaxID=1262583 RepID=A0A4R2QIV2_9PSEU|nr:DedA family protein [Tamaricihabitans halophyticus]TCP49300.1 membrane protein DedA with SNARE-associated domain [Tamaricihabitans halophyticus]